MKECVMTEVKPKTKREINDHDFICVCSECGHRILAQADFNEKGNLKKVSFSSKDCPNCGADIIKFVQYSEVEKQ